VADLIRLIYPNFVPVVCCSLALDPFLSPVLKFIVNGYYYSLKS
jgi:hypothetical protein